MSRLVRVYSTGEIVEVYLQFYDGIAYVSDNGIKFLFIGEYEELDV